MCVSPRRIAFVLSLCFALVFSGCSHDPHPNAPHPDDTASVTLIKNAPAGYYDTADESTSASLRSSLHDIIDDHTRIPYTSSATDTWNVLEEADEDPNNSSNVLDVYLNESYQKWGAGNNDYNREHSWPKSYGFPDDGSTNYPYTDCHHLFISNDSRNSSRGNKPYNDVGGTGTEYTTEVNNSVGGGSGTYPGWSNWADSTYWETWWDRRGDVARALMYLDVRYEGGTHGVTSVNEPDLILTDNLTLIQNSNTGDNESVAYMGSLTALLQWHLDDPVDAKEMAHNDAVYGHQGNRNPFVDHPEWVECVFGSSCTPSGGGGGGGSVEVWINEFHYDNAGGDTGEFFEVAGTSGTSLTGWSVVAYNGSNGTSYSTVSLSGTFANQQGGFGTLSFNLSGMQNGAPDGLALIDDDGDVVEFISYEGSFTATNGDASGETSVDVGVSESNSTSVGHSLQLGGTGSARADFTWQSAQANTSGAVNTGQIFVGGTEVWINEFHYDNAGSDKNEFVEIAGTAGTVLTGWTIVAYNGSNGSAYKTVTMSGTLSNQQGGFGTYDAVFSGLQNGAPDGIALVDDTGAVVQFLSYEGSLTASGGAADGLTSTDVGVNETSSTPKGYSLQLGGTGGAYADFTWQSQLQDTDGAVNTNQTFQ